MHNQNHSDSHIVTRNSKHVKMTSITAEQYLRDQLAQHIDDLIDKVLEHHEKLSTDKVQGNSSNKSKEETEMNKHNNIQVSDTEEHTINIVSNKRELTESSKQTVSDQHMEKHDDNINTLTWYGRISRRPDRLMYL